MFLSQPLHYSVVDRELLDRLEVLDQLVAHDTLDRGPLLHEKDTGGAEGMAAGDDQSGLVLANVVGLSADEALLHIDELPDPN